MTALVPRRAYLTDNRRRLIAHALGSTFAAAVPLPLLDDRARLWVLGAGYRHVAQDHRVDLTDGAVASLVFGRSQPANWAKSTAAAIGLRLASRGLRRAYVLLTTVNRARAAAHTYLTMTVFEHYCAKRHVGLGLDQAQALALRDIIQEAITQTPGTLGWEPFRRGALAAARASLRAPLALADAATGGALRRRLGRRDDDIDDAVPADNLDAAIAAHVGDDASFLGRAAAAIELQFAPDLNPYVDAVLDRFDHLWSTRKAP